MSEHKSASSHDEKILAGIRAAESDTEMARRLDEALVRIGGASVDILDKYTLGLPDVGSIAEGDYLTLTDENVESVVDDLRNLGIGKLVLDVSSGVYFRTSDGTIGLRVQDAGVEQIISRAQGFEDVG